MIKVLIKEPRKPAVLKEIEDNLRSVQSVVGGYIETITIHYDPQIILFCNEEGKLKGLEANFPYKGDLIVGTVFFARSDYEGNTIGLEDNDIELIQRLTGIEMESSQEGPVGKQYEDDRGWIYFVRAGLGENQYKTFYRKPDKKPGIGEHGYRNTPWCETFDCAQKNLDVLALVHGWKEV